MDSQPTRYRVDIVLCIDQTGSMSMTLDQLKAHAGSFHVDLQNALTDRGAGIDTLRIKVIGFRDFGWDGPDSMQESDFFELPEGADAFRGYLTSLAAQGGGDEPESGLEAVALAIRSDWQYLGLMSRQVVVVCSDAGTHPLGFVSNSAKSFYPAGLPGDLQELSNWWEGPSYLDANAKRLILCTPDIGHWHTLGTAWTAAAHHPPAAGQGSPQVPYHTIVTAIADSLHRPTPEASTRLHYATTP